MSLALGPGPTGLLSCHHNDLHLVRWIHKPPHMHRGQRGHTPGREGLSRSDGGVDGGGFKATICNYGAALKSSWGCTSRQQINYILSRSPANSKGRIVRWLLTLMGVGVTRHRRARQQGACSTLMKKNMSRASVVIRDNIWRFAWNSYKLSVSATLS